MKKLVLVMCLIFALFAGCTQEAKPHWSYKDCLIDIAMQIHSTVFDYTVKEIEHDEHNEQYDEVHCFDITVTYGNKSARYCCFTAIINGKVSFVDCDLWGG